jgi:hypothetical protein
MQELAVASVWLPPLSARACAIMFRSRRATAEDKSSPPRPLDSFGCKDVVAKKLRSSDVMTCARHRTPMGSVAFRNSRTLPATDLPEGILFYHSMERWVWGRAREATAANRRNCLYSHGGCSGSNQSVLGTDTCFSGALPRHSSLPTDSR